MYSQDVGETFGWETLYGKTVEVDDGGNTVEHTVPTLEDFKHNG